MGRECAYGSVGCSEAIHATFCVLEFLVREHGPVDFDDGVPEFLMMFL